MWGVFIPSRRSNLRAVTKMPLSPFPEDFKEQLIALQKPVLRFLASRVPFGLVSDTEVQSWKDFFAALPVVPSLPFRFEFPPDWKRSTSLGKSVSVLDSAVTLSIAPLSSTVKQEQDGPTIESITYPGFSKVFLFRSG